jgi:hypothetical protein
MRHAIVMTGRFESLDRIILDEQLPETFSKIRVTIESLTMPPKRRKAGALKGLIQVTPDFDDPLEDFQEYMR